MQLKLEVFLALLLVQVSFQLIALASLLLPLAWLPLAPVAFDFLVILSCFDNSFLWNKLLSFYFGLLVVKPPLSGTEAFYFYINIYIKIVYIYYIY